jgi:WS/DGAT C-terminal domain
LPITPFNMVCTNVPGPQFPLYLLGRKMLHCYPYVPVGGEMAVNCAILSYNGMVYFGFSGDVHAAPDLKRMEDLLMTSFAELRDAVGIKPPQKKKRLRKKRGVVAASAVSSNMATATVHAINAVSPVEPSRVPEPARSTAQENPLMKLIVA